MDSFEKDAELLEEGRRTDSAVDSIPSSPTLTNTSTPTAKPATPPVERCNSHWTSRGIFPAFVGGLRRLRSTAIRFPAHIRTGLNISAQSLRPGAESKPMPENIVRSLKDFHRGYPNLAAFADSDENFMLYRRFGYLQARVLLEKQDEMQRLEAELDRRDQVDKSEDFDQLISRNGYDHERKALLKTIETTYCEYANLLGAAHQLVSFNRPTRDEHRSVMTYLLNEEPVRRPEWEYARRKEDLITLRSKREDSWLDRTIERLLRIMRSPLTKKVFCSKESNLKASHKSQVYYCKERIERCSTGIVTLMILFLLIVPIYLLYHLVERHNGIMGGYANAVCIGILLVFTLLFSAVMSLFTAAKKHEILGAAAAYCAVLVVFLGNVGTNHPT